MPYSGDKKREYQRKWITDRREKYLSQLGECIFCSSTEFLNVHHIDPASKGTHRMWSRSDEYIMAELSKCVVLCSKCHQTLHALTNSRPVPHGTPYGYKLGCRCEQCRDAKKKEKEKYPIGAKVRKLKADGVHKVWAK